MRPTELEAFLAKAIEHKWNVLIKGEPGIGKTEIVRKACETAKAGLELFHPAISDPTDAKGLPHAKNGTAEFIPYGKLARLRDAKTRTVAFADDFGQAQRSVQAAFMQLWYGGELETIKLSEEVVWFAATNDTQHMSGVSGLIEPIKSRSTIIKLEVGTDDWCGWALDNGIPAELIAFMRSPASYVPVGKETKHLLHAFEPTLELKNSPCPRNWEQVGDFFNKGITDREVYEGRVGHLAATAFISFLDMFSKLPSMDDILLNPKVAPVPEEPGAKCAVSTSLAHHTSKKNVDAAFIYASRLEKEFEVCFVKDAVRLKPEITQTKPYIEWAVKNHALLK